MKLGFAMTLCAIDQLNLLKQKLLRMQALGSILEALGPLYGEIHYSNSKIQGYKTGNQKVTSTRWKSENSLTTLTNLAIY